ncbi:MAG: RnfABCDGE type electron transport complex subunit G [Synergistaceae bacterium]|jgi:electron transport complex protein RnfG|nr:RnfABCDGE type electron transport complex subunit G [Synergistaceae bacterium]
MGTANIHISASRQNREKILRLGGILCLVTAVTGIILGAVYSITLEPIRRTQERLQNEALSGALPGAEAFTPMEVASNADPMVQGIHRGSSGNKTVGHSISVTTKGYGGPIQIVVGVAEDGALRAIQILSQSETPGLGAKSSTPAFLGQYSNKKVERLTVVKASPAVPEEVQAISGATITSNAVSDGVNAALAHWRTHLAGGK